ncbi:MAG: hypothetical protein HY650_07775, partial [Acidobacteria bacterium]|nr:hypothetical protein [Acidobacteriota bacterium]
RLWSALALIGLLLAGTSASALSPKAAAVGLSDDAYHYRDFADGRNDGNYIEWWYFNFFDQEQDVQAIFTYFIADPENRSGFSRSQVAAVGYSPGGTVSAIDVYPVGAFSASYEQANVDIMGNAVTVLGEAGYRVTGASKDGKLAWDLTYLNRGSPWFGGDRIPVGFFPWEVMSWLVYMPSARVIGRLDVNGTSYSINTAGYHDHNWGEWLPFTALWNWAQYSDSLVSIELGDFIGKKVGVISLDFHGERVVFTGSEYQLTHDSWENDAGNRQRYPQNSSVTAERQDRRLTFRMKAIKTHPLRGDLPFPLPAVIIYEQTALFDGEVSKKNESGEWVVVERFSGPGFKEYTASGY